MGDRRYFYKEFSLFLTHGWCTDETLYRDRDTLALASTHNHLALHLDYCYPELTPLESFDWKHLKQ
jgi:hypothetical protein